MQGMLRSGLPASNPPPRPATTGSSWKKRWLSDTGPGQPPGTPWRQRPPGKSFAHRDVSLFQASLWVMVSPEAEDHGVHWLLMGAGPSPPAWRADRSDFLLGEVQKLLVGNFLIAGHIHHLAGPHLGIEELRACFTARVPIRLPQGMAQEEDLLLVEAAAQVLAQFADIGKQTGGCSWSSHPDPGHRRGRSPAGPS